MGALEREGRLQELPASILAKVPGQYRSINDTWIGVSARSRVLVYNTNRVSVNDLPDSILDLTGASWNGRLGWGTRADGYIDFITAMRLVYGNEGTKDWLQGIMANDPTDYPNNIALVDAVGRGEVDAGITNHYYLYRFLAERGAGFPVRNYYFGEGDVGGLLNVASVGILDGAEQTEDARRFIEFVLSEEMQRYFAEEVYEFPLVQGVEASGSLPPTSELEPPKIDLNDLSVIGESLALLQEVGVLP
jgi:iron(III) transport system substrate-binding protein